MLQYSRNEVATDNSDVTIRLLPKNKKYKKKVIRGNLFYNVGIFSIIVALILLECVKMKKNMQHFESDSNNTLLSEITYVFNVSFTIDILTLF